MSKFAKKFLALRQINTTRIEAILNLNEGDKRKDQNQAKKPKCLSPNIFLIKNKFRLAPKCIEKWIQIFWSHNFVYKWFQSKKHFDQAFKTVGENERQMFRLKNKELFFKVMGTL